MRKFQIPEFIVNFISRYGILRSVVSVVLIVFGIVSFGMAWPRISESVYFYLLTHYRSSLVVMILAVVAGYFFYTKKIRIQHIQSDALRAKYQTAHALIAPKIKETVQKAQKNISHFTNASNPEKWIMIRIPVFICIALIFIFTIGPRFLPPKIMTSFPENKSTGALLTQSLEVIFNRGVIKSTVEKGLKITPHIDATVSWEGDQKIVVTPKNPMKRGEKYTLSFNGLVLSSYYVPYLGTPSISFETVGNPSVVVASPEAEALEDSTPVTVVFDRPMIPLTTATNSAMKKSAFTISPEIKGEGRWLGTTAYQFRPAERLQKATTYTVTVPKGISSQDGGILQEDYTWTFSSVRPRVVQRSPERNYAYANPVASVSATFNQPVDPQTASEYFEIVDSKNAKVTGRYAVVGNMLGFYATGGLKREEKYTVRAKAGLKSKEGPNGMEVDDSWSFAVTAKPAVLSSTPNNGAHDIAEQNHMEVLFKTAMDEESFEQAVTIQPKPDIKPSLNFSSYDNKNILSINTYLGRSLHYTITIGANAKDQYGSPLGTPYTFSFDTASYKPSISVYPSGTYFGSFNQEITPRIVAQVVNANSVEYTLYKLNRDDMLDLYRRRYSSNSGCGNSDDGCRSWQTYDTSKLSRIRTWKETYDSQFNTPVHVVTKVTTESGENIPSGMYLLDMRIPQGPHDNMVMIVSKSTLTVKRSPKQIFSWGVNQTTGEVVPGMNMQLTDESGKLLSEGKTNADGVFMNAVDLKGRDTLMVWGTSGDDAVVAATAWGEGIDTYDFGLPNYYNPNESTEYLVQKTHKLFVTVDRPIYRPGQKVFFKGVIRKDTDGAYEQIKPGEKVNVVINDTNNKLIYSQEIPTTSFGSFSGEFILSREAGLGMYTVEAAYQGNKYSQQYQVEEYKKPELAVAVTPSKDIYLNHETAVIGVQAAYYFGAPVSSAPVEWTVQTQDSAFRWDRDWRFEFGDPDSYWSRPWWNFTGHSYFSSEKVTQGKGVTNAKGELSISLPLDISKYETSQSMVVEAVVNDNSNQSIAGSHEFVVHKAGIFAGLKPESYGNQSEHEVNVEVVTVDAKGTEVPETPVTVEFFKRTWQTIREQDPDDGQFYFTSKPSDEKISGTEIKTDAQGHGKASFTPKEGGTYKAVSTVKDAAGNISKSGSFVWVSGFGFTSARENNDRIVVISDKRDYLVGENMSIFVASPFASASAKTLLTAERGSVLSYKIVETSDSSNNFELPIPPSYTPNIFVGAVVVKPSNSVKNPPEFKIGYTEVKVTDKKQQIDVRISTDKKKYKPKETMNVTIETKDLLGHPIATELAVGLVDKAVWDLSNVELPDIYKTFYQPRSLDVATSQLMTISIDRINANTNLGSKGGSGGGCFTAETPVLLAGGASKPISEIAVGDKILTRQSDMSPRLVEAKVTNLIRHVSPKYIILNGNLRVTPEHRMYVNGIWKTAGLIERGDMLLGANNVQVPVVAVERVSGISDVYNLEVETYHTYMAGGVYVHNQKGGFDSSRTNFPDTAFWNPEVKTNAQGIAVLAIPLPDSLTTWRLGAIGSSAESAFGSATKEVVVGRDVLARPFAPRFLSAGDMPNLGGIIVNTSGSDQTFSVSIEGKGLSVLEANTKQVAIKDGAQAKVLWKAKAGNETSATITLRVSDSSRVEKDAVSVTFPIVSYSVPEVVATAGQVVNATAKETITLPSDVDPSKGNLLMTMSPSLGGAGMTALSYVMDYPYFCTEQTASRMLPAVFAHRLGVKAKLPSVSSYTTKQLEQIVSDGIQRLVSQQHSDGGWGWWQDNPSDPFMTAYALQALVEAKKDKFTVPSQTTDRASAYLLGELSHPGINTQLNNQAFMVYVLSQNGTGVASFASNLYARRFELSLEARAYTGLALFQTGQISESRRIKGELVSLVKKTATTSHWEEGKKSYWYVGSNTTTTASILEFLVRTDKKNPLIPEIIRYLLTSRTDTHWMTTRDTSVAIEAIVYQLLEQNDVDLSLTYKASLGGKTVKEASFAQSDLLSLETFILPISQLAIGGSTQMQITKSGQGTLYYNMNLKYYLPFTQIAPLEQGLAIVRELVDDNGKTLSATSIPQNSEVWERLIIVAPEERHFVIIEDMLPAGFESVNESLKNVSMIGKNAPKTKDGNNESWYFSRKEYHADKTTLFARYLPAGVYEILYRVRSTVSGVYHRPPAQVYQLYVPDVSGHSDGGWFEVK